MASFLGSLERTNSYDWVFDEHPFITRDVWRGTHSRRTREFINGCIELLGWTPERAYQKVIEIYDTVLRIFKTAEEQGITTNAAADQLAEERLRSAAV